MSTTLVLAAALLLVGRAEAATAIPDARALLDDTPPADALGGLQLLRTLRDDPPLMRRYVQREGLGALADLARAGATVDELVDVAPTKEREVQA